MTLDNIIKLDDVSVFQQDNLILSNVDLDITKGEFVYLIGKVGSGKSSLLKTLYSELPVLQGKAEVVGYDMKNIRKKQVPFLRRKIGIVFQDFQLLTDRNVHDNLHFVLKATGWKNKSEIEQRIKDVLEKTELEDKIYKMPHQLSGGEQQRVVIARALLNEPDIILADEPTGNLDSETSGQIMDMLTNLNKNGKTIIMVTHEADIARYAHSCLHMRDGKIDKIEQ